MLTELATAVLVLGLPVLLLAEEIARLFPSRAKVERTLPARGTRRAAAATQRVRVA
jgi:hypothetical protein